MIYILEIIMKLFYNCLYNIISFLKNKNYINIVNSLFRIDNYNKILPNLYLGNINGSKDLDFFIKNNIDCIINCTENELYHNYFDNKNKLRVSVKDSKDKNNIDKFKKEIFNAINFIDDNIKENKIVYVHCYWGLMRSATVIAAYLINKHKLTKKEAINIIRKERPMALISFYNFNEVLEYVELNSKD